ncbi:MAG TPA: wax ester/triacylglycerol synthase family O-acyltransferase [Bryobacteraceae bacterium]|nr:wax ester/triacylglycerol synthase family O-acyltransferase [Bryobacteraceae bacterium]
MKRHNPAERRLLSGADAAFLYLERKEIPLHIACVSVFDGPIPFEEFVAKIDSKLHLIPRYRQIAVAPPFHIGYPNWEWDPHFDIRKHVFRVTLDPPGGVQELEALAGRILSQVMDREKPLWDIYVIDGLKDGRGALIPRVHHALADGISGAALLGVILDPTPEASRVITKRQYRVSRTKPKPACAADGLGNAVQSTLENLLAAEAGLMGLVQGLLSGQIEEGFAGLVKLLPELAASVERLPFNRPCTGARQFCWTEVSFAEVQAIRERAGTTINDVILTVVTRAVARYVELHGEEVAHRFVRMVCPYSLRRGDRGETLGNQISFLPVALPLDVKNPLQMLRAVTERTRIMKCARAADLVALGAAWLGAAPPPLQALLWQNIPLVPLPLPLFNMICTNVPGSPAPLYSMGRRMLTSYPHVPTGYELGIGCAAQSYDGRVFFGLTSDTDAAPDADRLRDLIHSSFENLCRAAGVRRAAAARGRKPRVAPAA